ncbi:glycosyltransferase family 39 protein [Oryzibacter oryziterrae]|uniref:glycosyltransferase family 39 protein n=1 Tax=Oryzibacter oryziterrae TaxID=2766474 RepID=UPI001F3158EA|nr:glycosyltransferase family 39 protein [Oryzibacter oryziterrae]
MSTLRPLPQSGFVSAPAPSARSLLRDHVFSQWIPILVVITLVHAVAGHYAEIVPDEAYYWLWSRAPAFGYYDHPPMIAWWIAASTWVLGDGALAIRALPILAGTAVSLLLVVTAAELSGQSPSLRQATPAGRRAALWLQATPLVGAGAILATPDAPSVLFWTCTVWALARLRRTQRPQLWLLVGLFAGLGCVSKYTNLFLGVGIVLWLLSTPTGRRWLFTPWPYLGGLAALAAFSPVIVYDGLHHWASFSKQFGRIPAGSPTPRYLLEFLGAQFGLLNPLVAILAGTAVVGAWRGWNSADSSLRFLVLLTAPLVAYMALHALHDRVQGNWLAPVFPPLVLLAALVSSRLVPDRTQTWVLPVGFAASALGLLVLAAADDLPGSRILPTDRIAGWSAMADDVEAARKAAGLQWVATTTYWMTGELSYHLSGKAQVIPVAERERYAFTAFDRATEAAPGLLVSVEPDVSRFAACFGTIEPLGSIDRMRKGVPIARSWLFRVTGGKPDEMETGCRQAG